MLTGSSETSFQSEPAVAAVAVQAAPLEPDVEQEPRPVLVLVLLADSYDHHMALAGDAILEFHAQCEKYVYPIWRMHERQTSAELDEEMDPFWTNWLTERHQRAVARPPTVPVPVGNPDPD